jgi:hypothetical protein
VSTSVTLVVWKLYWHGKLTITETQLHLGLSTIPLKYVKGKNVPLIPNDTSNSLQENWVIGLIWSV